jgi:hypothetical protein
MIDEVAPRKATAIVELGVAVGDFSRELIKTCDPENFYAIDLFKLHEQEWIWGRKSAEIFGGKTHAQFYLDRLGDYADRVRLRQGDAAQELDKLDDASMDLIYIDASHHYADVVRDSAVAQRKVAPGGIIIFNDYILWSHMEKMWYGVVPVVNDLIVNKGANVLGLALQPNMYADIALQF